MDKLISQLFQTFMKVKHFISALVISSHCSVIIQHISMYITSIQTETAYLASFILMQRLYIWYLKFYIGVLAAYKRSHPRSPALSLSYSIAVAHLSLSTWILPRLHLSQPRRQATVWRPPLQLQQAGATSHQRHGRCHRQVQAQALPADRRGQLDKSMTAVN